MRALNSPLAEPRGAPAPYTPVILLFVLTIAARALMLTVMPLQAMAVTGDAVLVSQIYFLASIGSLTISLCLPRLIARFARPRVLLLGALLSILGPLLASLDSVLALALGLAAQTAAVAVVEVMLNLLVLDRVPRKRLSNFESLRLAASGFAWMAGPYLGVQLQGLTHEMPFYVASALGLVLLVAALVLKPSGRQPTLNLPVLAANPLTALRRFWRQPRLRLAWVLAMGRSSWWVMFFVYGPIFLVEELGYSRDTASALASAVMGITFLVPLWAWIGRRVTFRRLLIAGYLLSALSTLPLALIGEPPWLAAGLLVLASILTSLVDGAGNTPFLRAVKPLQKAEMTAVFMTYRDGSQLAVPGVCALLLRVFPLSSVFVATASGMLVLAFLARYLPKRF